MNSSEIVNTNSEQKNKPWLLNDKITGRTKHYTPANKEWKNSVYTFNPNHLKSVTVKQNILAKLIKGHFSINALKNIGRTKRKRSRTIRRSTRKFLVSKPEVKHSNDKINVTVYFFNREKQFYIRKLFYYKRKQNLYNSWVKTGLQTPTTKGKKIKILNLIKKRKLLFKRRLDKDKRKKINLNKLMPYYGLKLSNERDFFRYKMSYIFNKFFSLNKFYNYSFMYYLLTTLGVKHLTTVPNPGKGSLNISDYDKLNKNFLFIIKNCLLETRTISYSDISYLYNVFMRKKYKEIKSRVLRRVSKLSHFQAKLQINQLKLTQLISRLKSVVSKLYNKKTELNLVSLKHIHMNSDIFTQVIALKLRKKKNLLRVMKKSLNLVKVPNEFYFDRKQLLLNKYLDLNLQNKLHINKLYLDNVLEKENSFYVKDRVSVIFNNIFPNNVVNVNTKPSNLALINEIGTSTVHKNEIEKTAEILDAVKFKWVTGIRLEIAGRLTRRYKAARAVFKFKYKGNLKSKQYYMELGVLKKMPTIMLRNNNKVNSQYTFTKSKRRIGSYGIKNWISGY